MKKDIDLGGIEEELWQSLYYICTHYKNVPKEEQQSWCRKKAIALAPYLQDKRVEEEMPICDGASIPWYIIKPWESIASQNHTQSLERLRERGGLSSNEALCILRGEKYHRIERPTLKLYDLVQKRIAQHFKPPKAILWPEEKPTNTPNKYLNEDNKIFNQCLAECKEAERKRRE